MMGRFIGEAFTPLLPLYIMGSYESAPYRLGPPVWKRRLCKHCVVFTCIENGVIVCFYIVWAWFADGISDIMSGERVCIALIFYSLLLVLYKILDIYFDFKMVAK